MINCANVAATLMEHLCTHDSHGYTQGNERWGKDDKCWVDVDGITYGVMTGDRDCSSAVIDCWRQAIYWTEYQGALDGATYTGNMRSVFVNSGLFDWHPMGDGYIAQRGDVYLNERKHTAMCTSAVPDMLAEFSINEKGTITGGQSGDQTGNESHIRTYYNFPWDGILAYNGKANGEDEVSPRKKLVIEANHDAPNQRWRVVWKDGKVGWRSMASGNYIDVPDNVDTPQVHLGTYLPTEGDQPNAAQLFDWVDVKHGGVNACRFVRGELSMDVCDGNYDDGTEIMLYYTNDGGYPQIFLPVDLGDGIFILVNFGSYKVLTEVDY